ncbi:MAG: hypothetical protein BZY82_03710 [SAR202 cluster bacterium Io17-Chloro-G3]|nr:MAG: hypothetical protein BZY82_03710 [SAR202 cluster bacterium Io17-Chloro-G3]
MTTGSFPPFNFENVSLPERLSGRMKWVAVAAVVVILLILLPMFRGIYADWLWFGELGYRGVFVKVILTRAILFAVGFSIVAIFVAASLFAAYKGSFGPVSASIPDSAVSLTRKAVLVVSVLVVIVLGVIFGSIFSAKWELFLRFTNAASFGLKDPMYEKDISFFVFALPTYAFVQGWIFSVSIVALLVAGLIAFVNFIIRGVSFTLTPALRKQAVFIGALIVLIATAGLWVDRLQLVHSEGGVVYGATYADVHAKQLGLMILFGLGLLTAVVMVIAAFMNRMRIVFGVLGLWIILILALGTGWPSVVQQFSVDPNEFSKEQEYISRNMDFTREGYGLRDIEETFYEAEGDITASLISNNRKTIENIRLWDYRPLTSVYKQIQLIRPYYDFKDADVDRYTIGGNYRQVLLAAREVAPEKLDDSAQTWVNTKLTYTHGIGIAMSPVTEFTSEGRPVFFAKDIPADGEIPISPPDKPQEAEIIVENPRIYYGENTLDYVIVNTNTEELDYQTGEGVLEKTNYQGDGGVAVGSFIRKLVYAWEMGDVNILISSELNAESRIQYRRTIQDRVETIAPFLSLDGDPYIVADGGGLVWVQDAYTTSDQMPYSDPVANGFGTESSGSHHYNYIRNSVKIVVDAYDGRIDFYLWDSSDPLAETYRRIFPNLFSNSDNMPDSLRAHMRYPQGLFSVQAEKYIKYHMKDPEHFYGNEDLWAIPQEKFGQGETLQVVEPYYVIMKLPGEQTEEFVQLMPYTPTGRPNMVGWIAARSDGANYGKLVAYNFPKDRQVDGPEQVEARIDNDQDISAWFTLRCSQGSTCIRGNLLVIPVGDSLLYAEPVYIQAEGVSFPELKKVILATAHKVVMADSLEEALYQLTGHHTGIGVAPDAVMTSPVKTESVSGTVSTSSSGDVKQGDKIKNSLDILRAELDALEKLLENLENVR